MINYIDIAFYIIAIVCLLLGIYIPEKYKGIKWLCYSVGLLVAIWIFLTKSEE